MSSSNNNNNIINNNNNNNNNNNSNLSNNNNTRECTLCLLEILPQSCHSTFDGNEVRCNPHKPVS